MSASPSLSPPPQLNGQVPTEAQAQAQAQDHEQQAEVENADSIFPAPPSVYKRFTDRNLALARGELAEEDRHEVDFDLKTLIEPPSVDWIVKQGSWNCFGQEFYLEEQLSPLEAMEAYQLYDSSADRKQSLTQLLHTMLRTHLDLVNTLLLPPPTMQAMEQPYSDVGQLIEHIKVAGINMHYLVNELRPVQARETLKVMMRAMIDDRKAKTEALKGKCEAARATIDSLRRKFATPNSATSDLKEALEASSMKRDQREQHDWQNVLQAVDAL